MKEEKESVKEILGKVREKIIQTTKDIVSESHPGKAGTALKSLKAEEKKAVESIYDIFRVPEEVRNYDGRYWEKPFSTEMEETEVEGKENFDELLSSISREDLPAKEAWKVDVLETMKECGIRKGSEIPYEDRLEIVDELVKKSGVAKSTAKMRVRETLRIFYELGYFTRRRSGKRRYHYTLEKPLSDVLHAFIKQLK